MTTPTLDEMEARAQRHLDGMTVNRDAMARDVMMLCKAIRQARQRAKLRETVSNAGGLNGAAIDDLFGGLFGRR